MSNPIKKQKIIEHIPTALVVVKDNRILYHNKTFEQLLKYQQREDGLSGCDIEQFIDSSFFKIVTDYDNAVVDQDSTVEDGATFFLRNCLGHDLWVSCCVANIDWNHEPASIISLKDITRQKKVLETENLRVKIFRSAFCLVPDLMMILRDADTSILEINPAFANMTGYRRDDLLTTPAHALPIWADPGFFIRFLDELRTNTSMSDIPFVLKTRGNLLRHFRLFAQKISDEDTEPLILLVFRDVTDDMSRAQELQKSRDTAELANRAKSEFLANMSHELRTPLNAILGFAEIIRDQVFGEIENKRYAEYADDIHDSGRHLLSIINDILDISKVEAGRLEAHLCWLDPATSLEMCVSLVKQRAFENGITLETSLDRSIMIEADERLVKQIGLNLLSNAVKFTEQGGHVYLTLQWTEDKSVILTVEDTGIGMTADEIRIAKRPFGQVDSSLSRRQEGSGLGLPLVSAFTKELNATLNIHSVPGEGTKVVVTFPPEKTRRKTSEEDVMNI